MRARFTDTQLIVAIPPAKILASGFGQRRKVGDYFATSSVFSAPFFTP